MKLTLEKLAIPTILLIAICGSLILFVNSPWGVGVTHDSIFYLTSARNFIEGRGLQWSASDGSLRLLTHFPPLYPLFLAFMMVIGLPDAMAATGLTVLLFGLNIFTAGFLVYRFSQSLLLSILTAIALAVSESFVSLHLLALSEPLFIWLMMSSMGILGMYFEKPKRNFLVTAAIVSGLAVITRYIGLAIIATGLLALVFIEKTSFRTRIINVLTYLSVSLLPLMIWIVRNRLLSGFTTNRTFIFHPMDWGNRKLGFETIADWFTVSPAPYKTTIAITGLFVVVLLFLCLWLGWRLVFLRNVKSGQYGGFGLGFLFILFSLIYLAFLLASLTFFDASTRLDGRILAPIYISSLIAVFLLLGSLSSRWQLVGGGVFLIILALHVPATTNILVDFRENGRGFTGKTWKESQALAYFRGNMNDSLIYSNQGMALYYLTGRTIYEIPEKVDVVRNAIRDDYPARMKKMADDLGRPGSFIIWFAGGGLADSVLDDLGLDLKVYKKFSDADILAISGNIINGSLP
jgi:hypothetical protein